MTLEEVAALLDLDSAEAVADLLREHEVKADIAGEDHDHYCAHCPIATFANMMTGETTHVGTARMRGHDRIVDLPDAARAFIGRFDRPEGPLYWADLVAP